MKDKSTASSQMTETNEIDTTSNTAGTEEHMIPGIVYYDLPTSTAGRFIGPREPGYFELRKQLGGDAGTVDPYKSTVCAPIIEEWRKKQAKKH